MFWFVNTLILSMSFIYFTKQLEKFLSPFFAILPLFPDTFLIPVKNPFNLWKNYAHDEKLDIFTVHNHVSYLKNDKFLVPKYFFYAFGSEMITISWIVS